MTKMAKKILKKEENKGSKGNESMGKFIRFQDLFTMLNAAFGILSIFFSIEGNFIAAVIFMLFSVVFDYLDGMIGRKLNEAHIFGKELDSLADIVSFGVAPAVYGYCYYAGAGMDYGYSSLILTVSIVIFVLCGAMRLARFNITRLKGAYQGMPITINGMIFPAIYFAMLPVKYYFLIYLVSAMLMIGSFRLKKLV